MIKRLAACIGSYQRDSLLTPVFVILEGAMEVVIPLLMAGLIDNGISSGDMRAILLWGGGLILAALVSLLFGVLAGHFAAGASAGFAKNLRGEMFRRVQGFSFRNIDRFSTASLVTRLTTDVSNLQNAFQMVIRIAVRAPILLLFALVMAWNINHRLTLVFLCVIPFLAVGLYLIASRAHPTFERVFKSYDRLNAVVQENLRGIRVVKAFVREEHETEKFDRISRSIYADFTRAEKLLAFNSPLMQVAVYTCMLLISWLGARYIVGGVMTTGQLVSLLSYATQILMSLMMLSMIFVMLTISRASAERIDAVLTEESDLQNAPGAQKEVSSGAIDFDGVYFSYAGGQESFCLQNVNLHIRAGETVGIIGGTGSAKSTLISLIPRLYDASRGTVRVGGVDVRKLDMQALRSEVAVVLQKNVLFSGTIKENLRWGNPEASDSELIHACQIAQADGFIRSFPEGYDTCLEQGGTNVSGGQRQRLCIARALLKRPKILILDDSTSAVDTATDHLIRQALREQLPGMTKLIIAQRISSVMDADQIIVMDNGRISAIGTHEELLHSSEIYREVYDSQMKGDDTHAA